MTGRPELYKARRGDAARVLTVTCDHCGSAYLAYRVDIAKRARHYCSNACCLAARRGAANPNWRGGPATRICKRCGKQFPIYGAIRPNRGQFCSVACRTDARRLHKDRRAAHREHGRRREARERAGRAITGSHTPAEWENLKSRAQHRCVKCRGKRPLTRDHIIPLSKGGGDEITNIQPLCHPCNARKNNRRETLL